MIEEVYKSATLMRYVSNSIKSHWNAEKGTLNLNFVMVESHKKLYEILHEFTSSFSPRSTEKESTWTS